MQMLRLVFSTALMVLAVAVVTVKAQPLAEAPASEVHHLVQAAAYEDDDEWGHEREWARDRGGKGGRGGNPLARMMQHLPPEQRDQVKSLLLEHRRTSFKDKEMLKARVHELSALVSSDNPPQQRIDALVSEVVTLQGALFRQKVDLHRKLYMEAGVALPLWAGGGRFGR